MVASAHALFKSSRQAGGASPFEHRNLAEGDFWRAIPLYENIDEATFLDHAWQARNSVTTPEKLLEALHGLVDEEFIADARTGFARAPMSVRVSPYALSCADWSNPYANPIRAQFIPLASRMLEDHPCLRLDSLEELADSPVPGLTHRYPDKALFVALSTCPVYCRFCTRSYAIGPDTETVGKISFARTPKTWQAVFDYIAEHEELEDIVVSGGDVYQLPAKNLRLIGDALLNIPHVRRMRFASKGPAVMPMKLLTDREWLDALTSVVERGRRMSKEVVLHTHFNSPAEITWITQKALDVLFQRGITVRNQTVLMRGVNDDAHTMSLLVKRLGYINVQPYYVYMHDMVKGLEDLRTSVQTGLDLEKIVRGSTAGFNTPLFACDAPGGGGKRDLHSFEHYDRKNGIAVYAAPSVKPGRFLYFDPLHALSPEARACWADPKLQEEMIEAALRAAG